MYTERTVFLSLLSIHKTKSSYANPDYEPKNMYSNWVMQQKSYRGFAVIVVMLLIIRRLILAQK